MLHGVDQFSCRFRTSFRCRLTSATYSTGAPQTATGIATIVDDGSGRLYSGVFSGGTPTLKDGPLDDDRSALSIPDVNVNEASPYTVFQVFGKSGDTFTLALTDGANGFTAADNDSSKIDSQKAFAASDYVNQLQVYNGTTWANYQAGTQVSIPDGGSVLLVRVPLINDTPYEGAHAFTLTATPNSGAPTSGRGIIGDFGTGAIFNDSGAEDRTAPKDDDRQLKVDSPIVNEGSEHVVFRVSGITTGPLQLALQDLGIGTGFATLPNPNLQYWTGSTWLPYTGTALSPGTDFPVGTDPSGTELFVRVAIGEEQDTIREGSERFSLKVSGTGGPSLGTATIRDEGTGAIWLGASRTPATPAELNAAGVVLDDDFDRDGITPTTEDALATLAASQGIAGAPGDLNGDGTPDALQNALATLAWRDVASFNAGNNGTLTDIKPIISLSALNDASGNTVSNTLQLQNIRVVDYTDKTEFGSAFDKVSKDPVTGICTVTLASGAQVPTPWDPIRFELAPQQGNAAFTDIDPSRNGVQIRMFIDVRAAGLDQSAFNAYLKFVSQAAITAAGSAGLKDLDGQPITKEGWYDFTQRTPGGDGARFIVEAGKITGIEMILTDNSLGDNDLRANFLSDPGVPVRIDDLHLVPTSDGKGLKVTGSAGQDLWVDLSAVLADASLQNGYDLVRVRAGQSVRIGAIGATPDSGFLGDTRLQLKAGDELRFVQVSGDQARNTSPSLAISGEDNCIIVRLDDGGAAADGDADDLVLKVKSSDSDPYPLNTQMARHQLGSEFGYLDLTWIGASGIAINLDVKTEAGDLNTIGLVKVDTDASGVPLGTVDGVAPTEGAAFDAAVRRKLLGYRYSQSGDQTRTAPQVQVQGSQAGVYAPVLITEAGDLYTFGATSSSDGRQHLKVLGANSFAFEDAPSGKADWDYNDAVASFSVADPGTPKLVLSPDGDGLTVVAGTGSRDGLWLDLRALVADAGNQNSFDLYRLDASGALTQIGSVGSTSDGGFLGDKELFLGVGETLRFVQNSNDDQPNSSVALRITQDGERFRIALDDEGPGLGDGDFNDLVLDVDRSPIQPCEQVVQLASLQTTSSAGLLDLSSIDASGVSLNLAIQTDSGNTNTLSFVKLDSGSAPGQYSVNGVVAGNTDAFRKAVRDNLVDFEVSAGGSDGTDAAVWRLNAADKGIYAAVLLTPDNDVLTFGDTTAADGRQHLKVLGDSSFAFEDLLANKGGDFDYNDFVVKITPL